MTTTIVKDREDNNLYFVTETVLNDLTYDSSEFDYDTAYDETDDIFVKEFSKEDFENFLNGADSNVIYSELEEYIKDDELYPEFTEKIINALDDNNADDTIDLPKDVVVNLFLTDDNWDYFATEGFEEAILSYYEDDIQDSVSNELSKYLLDDGSDFRYYDESVETEVKEDTVKKSNGKWTNRSDSGKEFGECQTKKEVDAQRKAMFANK